MCSSLLATTHADGNVHMFDVHAGRHVRTLAGTGRGVWACAFHSAASHAHIFALGRLDGSVTVHDMNVC
jgi:WD40 repeat protein